MDTISVTDEQLKEALKAIDHSAINGIIAIAAGLRGRGLLGDAQVRSLHATMLVPLSSQHLADNPAVQVVQGMMDKQFATLLTMRDPDGY